MFIVLLILQQPNYYDVLVAWPLCTLLLQDEPDDALLNIITFSLAQIVT